MCLAEAPDMKVVTTLQSCHLTTPSPQMPKAPRTIPGLDPAEFARIAEIRQASDRIKARKGEDDERERSASHTWTGIRGKPWKMKHTIRYWGGSTKTEIVTSAERRKRMEEMNAEIEEEIKVMRAEREEAEAKKKTRKPRAPRKKKIAASVSIGDVPCSIGVHSREFSEYTCGGTFR